MCLSVLPPLCALAFGETEEPVTPWVVVSHLGPAPEPAEGGALEVSCRERPASSLERGKRRKGRVGAEKRLKS